MIAALTGDQKGWYNLGGEGSSACFLKFPLFYTYANSSIYP